jgi:hypothetical protein
LTQEEARTAAAEQTVIMRNVENKVIGVDDRVQGVSGDVQDVGGRVQMINERMEQVENNVQGVGDKVQGVDRKLEQVNRKSLYHHKHPTLSNILAGDQLRDSLFRWLSPPDPSINHNTASKAHHDGTAQWFFQGNIFDQWKSTCNFLWIHGKRAFLLSFITPRFLLMFDFVAGSGKSVLWFVLPRRFPPYRAHIVNSVPQSYKISLP